MAEWLNRVAMNLATWTRFRQGAETLCSPLPILRGTEPVSARDISRFSPRMDWIFSGEALNPFFGAQDEEFSEFCSTQLHSRF